MRLDRSGEGGLNPFDVNAVEEALRVKEASGDGEVVLVSVGPERAMESLRKALAMGADRALVVSDEAIAGADLVATSRVLAAALEREQPDLVLFGQQASDSDGAVLWAAVADRMRLPMISQAAELTLADGSVRAKRQTEYGYDVIEAPLPAVVAVSDAINEPRYPSLKGIMGAKKKPQEIVSLADLGVEPESRTEVYALNDPPPRGESRKIEDDGTAAQAVVDFLVERKLSDGHARLPRAPRGRSCPRARSACSAWRLARRGRGSRDRLGRRRRRGPGRRRTGSTSPTTPRSPRRSRSRASTCWRSSSATRASTPSCSPRRCSPPTSPRASPPGSTRG